MKRFRSLVMILCLILFAPILHAKNSFNDASLYPGTTIIAGDLSQNEFYIVEEKDAPKLRLALQEAERAKAKARLDAELSAKYFLALKAQSNKHIASKSAPAKILVAQQKPLKSPLKQMRPTHYMIAKSTHSKHKTTTKVISLAHNERSGVDRLRSALQKEFSKKEDRKQQATAGRFASYNKPHSYKDHKHATVSNKSERKYIIKSIQFDKHQQLVLREVND